MKKVFCKYFPFFSATIIALFLFIFVLRAIYTRPQFVASIIEDDIQLIALALSKIDAHCDIVSVENGKADINFLNVKAFAGSRIGPLNLAHPEKWAGPYVQTNPTMRGKFYELFKAKDGWFIVPGAGVALPNGLVMGKDIVLHHKKPITSLLSKGGQLQFGGHKLAGRLQFKIGDWRLLSDREKSLNKINRYLKEFNEAMPFAQNENKTSETC